MAHYLLFIPNLLLPGKTILEEDRNESIPWYSPFSYKKGGWVGDTLSSFLDVHNTQKSLLIGPVLTHDTRFRCPKELNYELKDKVVALVQNLSVAHWGGKKRLSTQHPAQSPCWLSEDTTQTKLSSAASIRTFRNFLPKWKLKCNLKHIHREETGREAALWRQEWEGTAPSSLASPRSQAPPEDLWGSRILLLLLQRHENQGISSKWLTLKFMAQVSI